MPNRRNPNKKQLQAWLWIEDMNVLESIAKEEGLELKEALELIIKEAKKKRGGQKP